MNKILIIGCARSGTRYAANVFQAMNFDVRHEREGKHGEASWYAVLKRSQSTLDASGDNWKVFHQVRDPLKVISSFYPRGSFQLHKYIGSIDKDESRLLKMMKYWVLWNKIAERRYDNIFRYKVEEFTNDDVLSQICKLVNKEPTPLLLAKVKKVSNTTHTAWTGNPKLDIIHKDKAYAKRFTWEDLKAEDSKWCSHVRLLAKKYGYIK